MTLIKCPECDHAVLSVASVCPNCSFPLNERRWQQGRFGSLAECYQCGRKVLSGASVCPHCGTPHPRRRVPVKWTVTALVAAALIPAGFSIWKGLERRAEESSAVAAGVARGTPAREPGVPAPTVRAPPREPLQPTAPAGAGSLVPVASMPATEMRWTNTWANVREGRGTDTPVIQILQPGQQIEVTDRQNGWWVAYVDGKAVGYVANPLLDREPPNP